MSKTVQCNLCPRRCKLSHDMRGDCKVRINIKGKLYSLVYGNPCAVHIDPIEKKPIFHMLPGSTAFSIATAGCNLHCKFCQNWAISQVPPEQTRNQDMPPEKVIELALKAGCQSIAYTYSDPIVFYEYTLDTAKIARKHGLKNILVTAGYMNPEPIKELAPWIDAANIDLKGFTEEFYEEMCSATLHPVKRAIELFHKNGVLVELTNLVIPTLNDNHDMIYDMCDWVLNTLDQDVPLHFSRFYPMYKLNNLPLTPKETLEAARQIAFKAGLRYVYVGNIPGTNTENTFCPNCGKVIIERIGYSIINNNLSGSKCTFCGQKIHGIWN